MVWHGVAWDGKGWYRVVWGGMNAGWHKLAGAKEGEEFIKN